MTQIVQRKPTFYPKWNTCFDCHLYSGRIINIIIRDSNTNEQIAEASVDAEMLSIKAKDKVLHQDWVFYIHKIKQINFVN